MNTYVEFSEWSGRVLGVRPVCVHDEDCLFRVEFSPFLGATPRNPCLTLKWMDLRYSVHARNVNESSPSPYGLGNEAYIFVPWWSRAVMSLPYYEIGIRVVRDANILRCVFALKYPNQPVALRGYPLTGGSRDFMISILDIGIPEYGLLPTNTDDGSGVSSLSSSESMLDIA